MGVMAFTAEAYARMLKALLPPGRLWRLHAESVLSAIFLAAGDELARVSGRARDLVAEADPRTTTELISEWERMLDLVAAATIEERRALVVALLTRRQRFRPADVKKALAPYLGLDEADVEIIETSRAAAIATGEERSIYRFHVFRNPALPGTYDVAAAQAELDKIAHSHTQGHIIESVDFLCDDPESLCDRDLLGI